MLVLVSCVSDQVTPWFCGSISLATVALNGCCSPVGTVAVAGVMLTAIPESIKTEAKLDFFGSAVGVAIILMVRTQAVFAAPVQLVPGSLVGSGTLLGAV